MAYDHQPGADAVMAEQIAYYRAVAAEYDSHSLQAPGGEELVEAIESFRPGGVSSSSHADVADGPPSYCATRAR